jgi:hypothetical protein
LHHSLFVGFVEVWGPKERTDPLSNFLIHILGEKGLLDVALVKPNPNSRNKRVGEEKITKRIDQFLVSNIFLETPLQMRKWVGNGGELNHSSIFLDVSGGKRKLTSPFKFNSS